MTATERIDTVREFNRFYTRHVGALNEGLLKSPYTLTEMRILYELHSAGILTAAELATRLSLDPAYLSRLLKKFRSSGIVGSNRSPEDGRLRLLSLTTEGAEHFAPYIKASRDEVAAVLDNLPEEKQKELLAVMRLIRATLGDETLKPAPVMIRPHRPGDMGWVIHRHGVLYAREYGFDDMFEALVARIAADFIGKFNPAMENCWIAEQEGEILGSVFLVQKQGGTAQLRLLYVEPSARGMGVGRKLVAECIEFARRKQYEKITLWTNSILHAAIHLYEEAGFILTEQEPYFDFGQHLVGQTWELDL
jgi:DNA-binding MarR family transcriptional regulator/N-acetylglutamate synthase-like GNAT family acetyltransferase|tara:strand:+ start:5719 stop:6639 length:921 start_codon:yes stop_codon:yes gene_type:complete